MVTIDDANIGDAIADAVFKSFNSLNGKGKPKKRSNNIDEWTVLASVVAVVEPQNNESSPEIKVLTLATGVKATPDVTIMKSFPKGLTLHDSHAEILALRLFNYYLIQEILGFENTENADERLVTSILKKDNDQTSNYQYAIREDVKLGLYISELPCGDCSLEQTQEKIKQNEGEAIDEWQSPVKMLKRDPRDESGASNNDSNLAIIRGRAHFTRLGFVRTKPGRSDSLVSLSKSCSDKLTIKQYLGTLNSITSLFINPSRSYLKWLILPKDKYYACEMSIKACFQDRFKLQPNSTESEYKLNYFEILPTYKNFTFAKHSNNQVPSMDAILCIPVYVSLPNTNLKQNSKKNKSVLIVHEVVNSGVKIGCKLKKNVPLQYHGGSIISRQKLVDLAFSSLKIVEWLKLKVCVSGGKTTDYIAVKQANLKREEAKWLARNHLKGWITTALDNFEINF